MSSHIQILIDYHENLINDIDIHTEKIILELSENEEDNIQIEAINIVRESFIKKVKEIQRLKSMEKFCFFIPNQKKYVKEKNEKSIYFSFRNEVGVLLILNEVLSSDVMNELCILANKEGDFWISDDVFESIEDLARTQLIMNLLTEKLENPIIDLTNIEDNNVVSFKIEYDDKLMITEDANFLFLMRYFDINKLQELTISNEVKLPTSGQALSPFRNLKKLSLICDMEYLEKDNFIYLSNLEELIISLSSLDSLQKGVFKHLYNLKKLILDNNPICKIFTGAFKDIDSLEILKINSNIIRELHKGVFKNLKNLKTLELNHNYMKKLASGCFEGLENLQCLSMNKNTENMRLNKRVFVELVNLEVLDLGNNNIKNFDANQFVQMEKLKFLNFRENLSPSFEFINHFKQLEFLDISTNYLVKNLDQINVENIKFLILKADKCVRLGQNFKSLQGLEIRNVTGFERNCFENLQNLDYLRITVRDMNVFENITVDDFKHLKRLKFFSIGFVNKDERFELTREHFELKRHIFDKLFDLEQSVEDDFHFGIDVVEDIHNQRFLFHYYYYYFYEMRDFESEKNYFEEILNVSPITREAITKSHYAKHDFVAFGPREKFLPNE